MNPMMEEPKKSNVLTAQEVSERLRVSLSTVHQLTRTGKLKGVKMGKQWRYHAEDIEKSLLSGFDFRPISQTFRAERRIEPRINCYVQGRAVVDLSPLKRWEGDGACLNISQGGMLFEIDDIRNAKDLIIQDDPIDVELYFLDTYRKELRFNARVIHIDENGKIKLGIKFRSLSPEVQKAIEEFIG